MSMQTSTRFVSSLSRLSILLAVFVLAMLLGSGKAWAGGTTTLDDIEKTKLTSVHIINSKAYTRTYAGSDTKVTAVKSSNTKLVVAKPYKYTYDSYAADGTKVKKTGYGIKVTYKKPGTAKISFKHNGKKHTVTCKASKYVNPFKTFKIGSTSLKARFNPKKITKRDGYERLYVKDITNKTGTLSGKVSLKMLKGWDLSLSVCTKNVGWGTAYQYSAKTGKWTKVTYSTKKGKYVTDKSFKARKTLNLKNVTCIQLSASNKKTGQSMFSGPIAIAKKNSEVAGANALSV